jgi:hypothetical protein
MPSLEVFESGQMLRLSAEMKLPRSTWLEFEVTGDAGGSIIPQTTIFDPVSLRGLMYWYLFYPLHQLVFGGMPHGIDHAAGHPSGRT